MDLGSLVSEMVRNDAKNLLFHKQHPTPYEDFELQASFNNPFRGAKLNLIELRRRTGRVSLMNLCPLEGSVEGQKLLQKSSKFIAGIVQRPPPKTRVPSTNPFG